jgi:NAD-dependent deacetylase
MEKVKQIKYPHNFKRHPYAKELFGFDYLSFIEPNSAHYSIVELERKGKLTLLISQNVDNLHLKSGFPPNKLIEIHGNCFKLICKKCNIHYDVFPLREKVINDLSYIPSCDKCGGALSSSVVNFGDPIPKKELEVAIKISKSADVFLSVGSSLVVEPASLLLEIAKKNNAKIIIINIGKTQKDKYADVILNGKAGDILTKIVKGL